MNAASEALARDKELLLMRSALCRLRLHHHGRSHHRSGRDFLTTGTQHECQTNGSNAQQWSN